MSPQFDYPAPSLELSRAKRQPDRTGIAILQTRRRKAIYLFRFPPNSRCTVLTSSNMSSFDSGPFSTSTRASASYGALQMTFPVLSNKARPAHGKRVSFY